MTERRMIGGLRNPWLVAVWPGMGNVAAAAGACLGQVLKPDPAGALAVREFFSVDHVDVQAGIARPGALPRSMLFVHRDPRGERDVILFIGEAQPASRGDVLAQRLVDFAVAHDIERIVTFAALGTTIDPAADPTVFGAVTEPHTLADLRKADIELLTRGRVGGLNGVLLAAAAERGVEAMCLLGEMPFYAAGVPNPKASLAVLRALDRMADLGLDLTPLEEIAASSESQLASLRDQFERQTGGAIEPDGAVFEGVDDDTGLEHEPDEPHTLDPESRRHIEKLFDAAENDRRIASELKRELDRLGAFGDFEDRFLDLFRRAG